MAAAFASYPAQPWPTRLCTIGVCAKATGATITFQLKDLSSTFGAITGCGPHDAFSVDCSAWPPPAPVQTSLILSPSNNPATAGQAAIFTATVSPSNSGGPAPTGNVTFSDRGQAFLTAPLGSNGSVTVSNSTLLAGVHNLIATYFGDANYLGSTSSILLETVLPGQPSSLYLTPSSGFPDTVVEISGGYFGSSKGSVFFNGTLAAIRSWSSGDIFVIVPAGATTGPVTVQGAGTSGQGFFTMSSGAPPACPVQ
ncbi:Ig-like domain repeat protein [Granulicella rosea]